ncbi:Protein of unknown function [Gryllus bimaculatus]|nr:Protein of unknown function [Gryllus bimaculatus]
MTSQNIDNLPHKAQQKLYRNRCSTGALRGPMPTHPSEPAAAGATPAPAAGAAAAGAAGTGTSSGGGGEGDSERSGEGGPLAEGVRPPTDTEEVAAGCGGVDHGCCSGGRARCPMAAAHRTERRAGLAAERARRAVRLASPFSPPRSAAAATATSAQLARCAAAPRSSIDAAAAAPSLPPRARARPHTLSSTSAAPLRGPRRPRTSHAHPGGSLAADPDKQGSYPKQAEINTALTLSEQG